MSYSINRDDCIGCGACVDSCKSSAIVQDDDKYKIIPEKCSDCGDCAETCPVTCITSGNN